jgi:hypothetical protein
MLAFGLVLGIAAVFVVREAGRVARKPPPALFDLDDVYDWVVEELADDVAASLTPDDVRRILDFSVEFMQQDSGARNGSGVGTRGPIVFGGAESVAYICGRAAATGEAYFAEQVHAVVECQLSYLRFIGAVGPANLAPGETPGETPPG